MRAEDNFYFWGDLESAEFCVNPPRLTLYTALCEIQMRLVGFQNMFIHNKLFGTSS